jgi:hypothetical protein
VILTRGVIRESWTHIRRADFGRDEVFAGYGIEAGVPSGVDDFRAATATLPFRPGQYVQLGAMEKKADIAITLRALGRRLRLQVARVASLAEEVMPPAAEATAVFGPDINSQANEDEQDTFDGSWIELHELNG